MSDTENLAREQLAADRCLRNDRFARGEITEEEISQYWRNPHEPLFEHTLAARSPKKETTFRVRGLTAEVQNDLIANVADAWGITDLEQMRADFQKFIEQNSHSTPRLLNAEYYVATDVADKPFATVGLYSYDIQGAAGLATRKQLDLKAHSLITGVGWYGVSKNYQGTGVGKFLLEWLEKMAKHRCVDTMFIETDDDENAKTARKLYEKLGYKLGFDVPDYFGNGRDLATYWIDVSLEVGDEQEIPDEKINTDNRTEILDLARKIYSPIRFQEFGVCLDLLLKQPQKGSAILEGDSLVVRDPKGNVESFAILSKGSYANQADDFWDGADPSNMDAQGRLISIMKASVKKMGKDILIVSREGRDERFKNLNFQDATNGIPRVFARDNNSRLLLYTKKLN
jgi:GNAT superfamily N-acetyltransferase